MMVGCAAGSSLLPCMLEREVITPITMDVPSLKLGLELLQGQGATHSTKLLNKL